MQYLQQDEKIKTDNEDALSLLSNKITLLLAPDSDLEEEKRTIKSKKRILKKSFILKKSLMQKS